jgi:outer membrane protein OmpA-like peptidoglycan-associated protein
MERAEAVRNYLSRQHGIALHRMNVISSGEAEPVADNGTREGRAQNRRVMLVVLA